MKKRGFLRNVLTLASFAPVLLQSFLPVVTLFVNPTPAFAEDATQSATATDQTTTTTDATTTTTTDTSSTSSASDTAPVPPIETTTNQEATPAANTNDTINSNTDETVVATESGTPATDSGTIIATPSADATPAATVTTDTNQPNAPNTDSNTFNTGTGTNSTSNSTGATTPTGSVAGDQTTNSNSNSNDKHGSLSTNVVEQSPFNLPISGILSTNQADYSPTDTAIITGSGFDANKAFTLEITSSDQPPVDFTTTVLTNATGSFTYSYQLDGNYRPNYTVYVKDRSIVVATITFTDSSTNITSALLNGAASVTVAAGVSISASVTATLNSQTWKSTKWTISSPGGSGCFNNTDHTTNGSFSESFNITSPSTDGTYDVTYTTYKDNDGCTGAKGDEKTLSNGIIVDTTPPNLVSKTAFPLSWYTSNQISTFTYADSGSGIASGTPVTCDITTEGTNQTCSVTPNVCDAAGNCNTTPVTSNGTNIDKTSPTTPGTPTTTSPTGNDKPTWTWTAATDNIGVDHYIFYWDTVLGGEAHSSGSLSSSTSTYTHSSHLADGTWYAKVRAYDTAGNNIDSGNGTVIVDTTDPVTRSSGTDTNWHNSNVTVTLSCNDGAGSGCDVTYWTTDGSAPTAGHYDGTGNSVVLTTDGSFTIKYFSVDHTGNQESVKTAAHVVNIDQTKPTDPTDIDSTDHIAGVSSTNPVITMAWTAAGSAPGATDNLSGVDGYSYSFTQGATDEPDAVKIAEGNTHGTTSPTLTEGSWWFHLRTVDNAGNWTDTVHKGPYIIALPDLTATKTNNVGGAADVGEPFTWTIRVQNNGTADAVFANNKQILLDNFPNTNVNDYGAPVISDSPGVTGSINCTQGGGHNEDLTCKANGTVTITPGGYFDVDVDVTTTAATTFENPRSGQTCRVNPNADVTESNSSNNDCADSVVVTGTPTAGNRPDFAATKTNNADDSISYGSTFRWTIRVQNVGTKKGRFSFNQVILQDDLPSNATYGSPSVLVSGTGGNGSISCSISTNTLTCSATGTKAKDKVEFPSLSYFDVSFDVTPTVWGTITNPISGGVCLADPSDVITENGEANNSCSNSVTVEDTIDPSVPVATPGQGDYPNDTSVDVNLTSDDTGGSGLAGIYYTTDGTTPDNLGNGTLFVTGTPIVVDHDLTLKAIAYDNAGNASDTLTAVYGIPPIISSEASTSVGDTTATITWTTDDLSTSRVVYDTVSHLVLGAAPNYGYASSTDTFDTDLKLLSHSVGLTGLSSGTTYYYRTISHGSPEAVSAESSFTTTSPTVAGTSTSDSGSTGGGPYAAPVCNETKPGSAPTLTSAVAGTNSVTLFWTAASDPVTYYLVTYGNSSGAQTYGNPNVGGKGTTSYTVSGLSGGTTYYFKVRAGNGCAPGDYSNEVSATPGGGVVQGPAAGFAEGVLGANKSATEAGQTLGEATPAAEVVNLTDQNKPSFSKKTLAVIGGGLIVLIAAYLLYRHKRKKV